MYTYLHIYLHIYITYILMRVIFLLSVWLDFENFT